MDFVREMYPEVLLIDGFEECIKGIVIRFGQEPIACYDQCAVIEKLMKDGMDEEQAIEYFEFNQLGAWMGNMTPCFIDLL